MRWWSAGRANTCVKLAFKNIWGLDFMAGFTKRAIRNILAVVGVDFHFSRLYDEEEVG